MKFNTPDRWVPVWTALSLLLLIGALLWPPQTTRPSDGLEATVHHQLKRLETLGHPIRLHYSSGLVVGSQAPDASLIDLRQEHRQLIFGAGVQPADQQLLLGLYREKAIPFLVAGDEVGASQSFVRAIASHFIRQSPSPDRPPLGPLLPVVPENLDAALAHGWWGAPLAVLVALLALKSPSYRRTSS